MMTTTTAVSEARTHVDATFDLECKNGIDGFNPVLVNSMLREGEIDTADIAASLENRGIDVELLSARIKRGLEVTPLAVLVAMGYPAETVNDAMGSTCRSDDLNTAFFHMAL